MQIDKTITGEFTRFFKKNPALVEFLTEQNISLKEATEYLRQQRKAYKADFNTIFISAGLTLFSPIVYPIVIPIFSFTDKKSYGQFLHEYHKEIYNPGKDHAERSFKKKVDSFQAEKAAWENSFQQAHGITGDEAMAARMLPKPVFKL